MRAHTIMNGFGRFGLHMSNYYLDNHKSRTFDLIAINDEKLTISEMVNAIKNDRFVRITDLFSLRQEDHSVYFSHQQFEFKIEFYNLPIQNFVKLGKFQLLECSGRYTDVAKFPNAPKLERIYISATSLSADRTVIVGLDRLPILNKEKFISYGSCTVNAFVPLANSLNLHFGVKNADVNVIHNLPEYQLKNSPEIFERRGCTLAFMGPKLLNFLNSNNFNVNYTIVPMSGVSRIDFRFELESKFEISDVIKVISMIKNYAGDYLYNTLEFDLGPNSALMSKYSAEIILEQSRKVDKHLYLSAYFDTENSVNRFYDLVNTESGYIGEQS